MKNLSLFISLFYSLLSFSQEAGVGKVFVHSMEEGVDLSGLQAKEYVKVEGAGESKSVTSELPSPPMMEKMLLEADLSKETVNMDQMDKDLLFMKLKKRSAGSLSKNYPDLPKSKLEKLKSLMGAI